MSLLEQAVTNPSELALMQEIFDRSEPEHLQPFNPPKLVTLGHHWGGRGRATLVGDAAHAMRPTDGQGGNQAFEDAVVLARSLANRINEFREKNGRHIATAKTVESALREFEDIRLPRVRRIHENQSKRYEQRMRGQTVEPNTDEFAQWRDSGV